LLELTGQTWDQGSNTIIIYANDTAGNENKSSITFTVDNVPPYFQHAISNFELTIGQAFNYDVNATDASIGLEGYAVNDSNFQVNSSGWISNNTVLVINLYYINISINDTLGNSNSSIFYVNITDTTIPLLTIDSPLAQAYNTNSIGFNITSNENLSSCRFTLTNWATNYSMMINATKTGANYTNTSIGDGSYTARFWCNDTSNNINNTETVAFSIDATAPTISIVYPTNNTNTTNINIPVNYTVSGATYCQWSNDSGVTNKSITCGSNITGQVWDQGSNIVMIWANDTIGNENKSSITFNVDTIEPTISIASPLNNTNTTNINIPVNYTVAGATYCQWSNDSGVTNKSLTQMTQLEMKTKLLLVSFLIMFHHISNMQLVILN
jgi:hypothetical protein